MQVLKYVFQIHFIYFVIWYTFKNIIYFAIKKTIYVTSFSITVTAKYRSVKPVILAALNF